MTIVAEGGCLALLTLGLGKLGFRSVHFLRKDEQVRVDLFTEPVAHNGPMDYAKLADNVTKHIDWQDIHCRWAFYVFPECHEVTPTRRTAIVLQADEYIQLKDQAKGERWVQKGKALAFLESTWRVESDGGASDSDDESRYWQPPRGTSVHWRSGHGEREAPAPHVFGVRKAWTLKAYEYVRLLDKVTGKVSVHQGEKTVFPGLDETLFDNDKLTAIDSKVDEYVKVEDQTNGKIRVVTGATMVFLGASERVIDNGKEKAIQIHEEHAVFSFFITCEPVGGQTCSAHCRQCPVKETIYTSSERDSDSAPFINLCAAYALLFQ